MKKIEPIQIWQNGQQVEATYFAAVSQSDNLKDAASFQYTLFAGTDNPSVSVASGGFAMGGEDYANWDGSNDYPYIWLAEKLNLQIIGDYVKQPEIVTPVDTPIEAPLETTQNDTNEILEG